MTREGVMSQGAGPRLPVTKLRRWPRSGRSKATLRQSARWGGMTREQPTLVRRLLKAVEIESVGKGVPWWVPLLSIEDRLGNPDPGDLRTAIAFAQASGWLVVNSVPAHFVAITPSGAAQARNN